MTAGSRVVIFDFGGVLVDWNPRYLYRRLFPGDPDGMERFLAEVCTPRGTSARTPAGPGPRPWPSWSAGTPRRPR